MSLVQIDLIVSIADKIASLLVRGLLESGTFSILVVIWPNFPRAIISCVFLVVLGSAIIFTSVSWLPNPERLSSAETLIFFGNSLIASFAVPSKIVDVSFISSGLILKSSKNFAPFNEFGCFVVVKITESSSSFTDFIASIPDIAPDGR